MATYPRRGFASVADLHTVEEDRAATNHENPTVRYNRFLFSDLRANKYVGPVTDRFLNPFPVIVRYYLTSKILVR